jgi:hypothetical protein
MADRDPLRPHLGRKPAQERLNSIRPIIDSATRLLTEGRRVTPIGIAVSVSLPIVLVFGIAIWILGKDGLVEVASAWRASASADSEMAKQVERLGAEVAALRKESKADTAAVKSDLAAYAQRVTNVQKAQVVADRRTAALCDLLSVLNGGRPREDWCGDPGQGIIFFPPSMGALTPLHLTSARWPQPEQ